MSAALKLPLHRMTVVEFLDWDPGDDGGARWQLRDGEPEMMAPPSDPHGSIQSELAYLVTAHLRNRAGSCRIVVTPGVVPAERSEDNCLVPDLGVTCAHAAGARLMHEPLVLTEILSPTNVSRTRDNVRAYRTIPSVVEIVVLRSTSIVAEILRRGTDGTWPDDPEVIGVDDELVLVSIGFSEPLHAAYRTSGLV
jgi:Uma2 family endonuclease